MADHKQNWKDALQAAKPSGSRSNDPIDKGEAKKRRRIEYTRRKLNKDIKEYTNKNNPIKFKEIEKIHNKHGLFCYEFENTELIRSDRDELSWGSNQVEFSKSLRSRYGDDGPKLPGLDLIDDPDF